MGKGVRREQAHMLMLYAAAHWYCACNPSFGGHTTPNDTCTHTALALAPCPHPTCAHQSCGRPSVTRGQSYTLQGSRRLLTEGPGHALTLAVGLNFTRMASNENPNPASLSRPSISSTASPLHPKLPNTPHGMPLAEGSRRMAPMDTDTWVGMWPPSVGEPAGGDKGGRTPVT